MGVTRFRECDRFLGMTYGISAIAITTPIVPEWIELFDLQNPKSLNSLEKELLKSV
ncbi:hypothetical protein [Anabaena sp. PCC 7108]|uniref:hypothetical protein n=1 Tax=Anabaena sp. PCC 7108 TaxID=163908 RepID=UPI00034A162F|nr:hypothetical protein [Anabaena sp. PCC 7108]